MSDDKNCSANPATPEQRMPEMEQRVDALEESLANLREAISTLFRELGVEDKMLKRLLQDLENGMAPEVLETVYEIIGRRPS